MGLTSLYHSTVMTHIWWNLTVILYGEQSSLIYLTWKVQDTEVCCYFWQRLCLTAPFPSLPTTHFIHGTEYHQCQNVGFEESNWAYEWHLRSVYRSLSHLLGCDFNLMAISVQNLKRVCLSHDLHFEERPCAMCTFPDGVRHRKKGS